MTRTRRTLLGAVCAAALLAALPGSAALASAGQELPAHVFAPYIETYDGQSPSALSQASGAKYVTLAFIETPTKGSCTIDWNGDTTTPISSATYGHAIALIRARGGDVIPSFGGYSADHEKRDIADTCPSISKVAAAYEKVVTTYDVTRLDLDVEDKSLTHTSGIKRRSKAIRMVQLWAAAHHRVVHFSYTLPASTVGLDAGGLRVLHNSYLHDAHIRVVNAMTFDFYDEQAPGDTHEMATDSERAALATIRQMRAMYPHQSTAHLWRRLGMTEMIGIDDYGPAETFTTDDAAPVLSWATDHHLALLSFWALQRDNGGCVGDAGSDSCSGVAQTEWEFSHVFEPFTS